MGVNQKDHKIEEEIFKSIIYNIIIVINDINIFNISKRFY